MGICPPAFPNILSKDCCTLAVNCKQRWSYQQNALDTTNTKLQVEKLTQQVVIGVTLILEGESAVTDVVQVLQPLEVRDSHTTSVHVQILRRIEANTEALLCQ